MTIQELAAAEIEVLRRELHDLKDCQIKFLSATPILTGFLLSISNFVAPMTVAVTPLAAVVPTDLHARYLLALAPLLVLLPAWWVFFDKAKTVTRIVGYYRVLEEVLRSEQQPERFLGWERSLELFRRMDAKSIFKRHESTIDSALSAAEKDQRKPRAWWRQRRRVVRGLFLREDQRYWWIAYDTFLILSVVCLGIAIIGCCERGVAHAVQHPLLLIVLGAALFSIGYCAIETLATVNGLLWGAYSYTANHILWLTVFYDEQLEPKHQDSNVTVSPGEQLAAVLRQKRSRGASTAATVFTPSPNGETPIHVPDPL